MTTPHASVAGARDRRDRAGRLPRRPARWPSSTTSSVWRAAGARATAQRLVDAGIRPIVGDVADAGPGRPARRADPRLPRGGPLRAARRGPELACRSSRRTPRRPAASSPPAPVPRSCTARAARRTPIRAGGRSREDDPPGVHLGMYSLSKIAGEEVVKFAAGQCGSPLTIIRIFSTYGPEGGAPVTRLRQILARRGGRAPP